jgi:hypothetical protein
MAWWLEAPSKLTRRLCEALEKLCEGHCARPVGAAKSNSSKARREGRQVVWPSQVLELMVWRIPILRVDVRHPLRV